MERCKTCRWWDSVPLFSDEGDWSLSKATSDIRYCLSNKVVLVQGLRERQSYDDDDGRVFRIEADEALATDGSEYTSHFATGPEFGCVHWQAKEGSDG